MMKLRITCPDGVTVEDWFSLEVTLAEMHDLRLEGYSIDILDVRR
jgi:hypothetical protein